MGLLKCKPGNKYDCILLTMHQREGVTQHQFAQFVKNKLPAGCDVRVTTEPYKETEGHHFHAVCGRKVRFKVNALFSAANKDERFKGMDFRYFPDTRKVAGAGYAAKFAYGVKYMEDPSKDKVLGEVETVYTWEDAARLSRQRCNRMLANVMALRRGERPCWTKEDDDLVAQHLDAEAYIRKHNIRPAQVRLVNNGSSVVAQ